METDPPADRQPAGSSAFITVSACGRRTENENGSKPAARARSAFDAAPGRPHAPSPCACGRLVSCEPNGRVRRQSMHPIGSDTFRYLLSDLRLPGLHPVPREAHFLRHTEVRHRVAQSTDASLRTVQSTTNHFPLLSEDRWTLAHHTRSSQPVHTQRCSYYEYECVDTDRGALVAREPMSSAER